MTALESRAEDIGKILIQAQEDVHRLKERVHNQEAGKTMHIKEIEDALAEAEENLEKKTEKIVRHLNNQVTLISPLEDHLSSSAKYKPETMLETQWQPQSHLQLQRPGLQKSGILPLRKQMMSKLSPGKQISDQLNLKTIADPCSKQNRHVLNKTYGIQLPMIQPQKLPKIAPNRVITGSNLEPAFVLPKANRLNPLLTPPPIKETDSQMGILNLMERGLIPHTSQLTLEPSPVEHKSLLPFKLLDEDKSKKKLVSEVCEVSKKNEELIELQKKFSKLLPTSKRLLAFVSIPEESQSVIAMMEEKTSDQDKLTTSLLPVPPTTPANGELVVKEELKFIIQRGKVMENTLEYQTFKQQNSQNWGSIVTILRQLETLMTNYAVPFAFINGNKLADMACNFQLERDPSLYELVQVILNKDDVQYILSIPGRKYVGPNGATLAACKIQATWRGYLGWKQYICYKREKWATEIIGMFWLLRLEASKIRQRLKCSQADNVENNKQRTKIFKSSWHRIKHSKRVVIHLPSLGLSQKIRNTIRKMDIMQNAQAGRLCDIKDPNVDVVLVSPVTLHDEVVQYYSKLMGLKAAVDSGDMENQTDISHRFKIIEPDGLSFFCNRNMCLSTILKYSPHALKRIKSLIQGREAYIITRVPHIDDLEVANYLNVPIFSTEPDIFHLYSSKSGVQRIFESAKVSKPPEEYDVYSLGQLFNSLVQLILDNLMVKRWLIKIDSQFDGNGIAYCDITENLNCYTWLLKEEKRYKNNWKHKWAQEAGYNKVLDEIPGILARYMQQVNKDIYPNWNIFLDVFLMQGGIIQAYPPSDSVTILTVDMLIEPNGQVEILCSGDQIHAGQQFTRWGMSVPQTSIDPQRLNEACYKIAEACKARAIIGHISVDFATFIDPRKFEQELWALDLSLCYSNNLSMFQLMHYITHGKFNPEKHTFNIESQPDTPADKKLQKFSDSKQENYYGVMSTNLKHSNLSVIHYGVFFQMCRAHGIGYDVKEKEGTAFTLVDCVIRDQLGMLTINKDLQMCLAMFAQNLSVIHHEVSTPNMMGKTNFQLAIEDIESILGTTIENAGEENKCPE